MSRQQENILGMSHTTEITDDVLVIHRIKLGDKAKYNFTIEFIMLLSE